VTSATKAATIDRACSLCGSAAHRQKYAVAGYRVVECAACGFAYLDSVPAEALQDLYQEHYFRGACRDGRMVNVTGWDYFDPAHLSDVQGRSRQTLAYLEGFAAPGKLLDIGCGPGVFLSVAASRGWTPFGFDISEFAVTSARERFGLRNVTRRSVEEMDYAPGSFDAVTLFHVIEHVVDPGALARACHRIIRPGGLLVVETPDISTRRARRAGVDWKYLKIPEHLNYFSQKTLSGLLTRAGFRTAGVRRATDTTGALNALCGGEEKARQFYARWSQRTWFRWLVTTARSLKETVSGRLLKDFDNITVVAQKR
jgi:2-polyprenyl-3-methyl-5-hydroxy-6-metoxy-1,4-benzoquinol methylase